MSKIVMYLFSVAKPLCCCLISMWTPWPTAWSAFSIEQILLQSHNMFFSGFCLLYNRNPTDPLVAGERCQTVPFLKYCWIGSEDFFEISGYFVDDAGGYFYHIFFLSTIVSENMIHCQCQSYDSRHFQKPSRPVRHLPLL